MTVKKGWRIILVLLVVFAIFWLGSTVGKSGWQGIPTEIGSLWNQAVETVSGLIPQQTASAAPATNQEIVAAPHIISGECIVTTDETDGVFNFRSGPDTNYAVVGNVGGNTNLTAVGYNEGSTWIQVLVENQTAWIYADLLAYTPPCAISQ